MQTDDAQTQPAGEHANRPRGDGFSMLRFFAAFLVFHSHFFALRGDMEPTLPWTPGSSYGAEGVLIFFAISGSLVGRSALNRSTADFLVSRFLRIQPALIACTLLLVCLGAAITTLPLAAYIAHPDTLNFLNIAAIWINTCRDTLPGVFVGRRFIDIDGSLWTLRYEVLCYGWLAAAGLIGPRAIWWGAFMALLGLPIDAFLTPDRTVSIGLLSYYSEYSLLEFAAVFAIGVLTCSMNRRLLSRSILAAALSLALCWHNDALRFIAWHALIALGSIYVGRYARLDRYIARRADISYGFYIYAYPMTQLAQSWFRSVPHGRPLSYITALCMSVALATASWFLIERRALALKAPVTRWLEPRLRAIPNEP